MIPVRHEVWPFLGASIAAGALLGALGALCGLTGSAAWRTGLAAAAILSVYMVFFFRNPTRTAPDDADAVVAGADGVVARIAKISPAEFAEKAARAGLNPTELGRLSQRECIRISIFLSLFDVHVNRSPIAGRSRFLGYFPGKRFFTFQEKSSDRNQHNSILIENDRTACLFNQIVGPVCRRVVYWPDHDRTVDVRRGDPIGMMKFGSRLDMIFPREDIALEVREGERVRAGETIIARMGKDPNR